MEILKDKCKKKNITNISIYESPEKLLNDIQNGEYNLLLIEVIEHMPYKDAIELVSKLIDNINFKKFIITTPNI